MAVVGLAFHTSIWEAEAVRALSSRQTWSTNQVIGQAELHRENIPKQQRKKKYKKIHKQQKQ